jgi:hypothetical protein
MTNTRKQRTPPIIIYGKRYKHVKSHDGLCDKCAGKDVWAICRRLPSCDDGRYFVEVKKKP